VSTPNKHYYAESRRLSGPNPFHEHEFEFSEFREALQQEFAHVSMFLQNQGGSIAFQPVEEATGAEVRVEGDLAIPEQSNFFVAVCAAVPQTGSPAFVYVPSVANVLRERGVHIRKLEKELATKDEWLGRVKAEHQQVVEQIRDLNAELEERNRWAERLNQEVEETNQRFKAEIAVMSVGYEQKITQLHQECEEKADWAVRTQQTLDEKLRELAHCVEILHETEKTLEERTAWARELDRKAQELGDRLALMESSRWVRVGRALRLGPVTREK
jgi:hypothetical protein